MSAVSNDWIEKEITQSEEKLLEVEHDLHFAAHEQAGSQNVSKLSATPLSKLKSMEDNIDTIALAHDYHCVTSKYSHTTTSGAPNKSALLTPMIQFCRKLGTVLLHHDPPQQEQFSTSTTCHYQSMYDEIRQQYERLYRHLRARLLLDLRGVIRSSGFPSKQACEVWISELKVWSKNQYALVGYMIPNEKNGRDDGRGQETCLGFIFWSLIELDVLRQTVLEHILGEQSCGNQKSLSFMNELIRPILDRVRYHFLQHVNGGTTGKHEVADATHEKAIRFTSSRLDRLPEWVLIYIKEIMMENGVWNVLHDCVKPMTRAVTALLNEEISKHDAWTELTSPRKAKVEKVDFFFISEMIRLTKYVLDKRKFFRDASIIGGDRNPNKQFVPLPLCNAIEQFLQFDQFVSELINDDGYEASYDGLSRFSQELICCDDAMFNWWIHLEKYQSFQQIKSAMTSAGQPIETQRVLADVAECFLAIQDSLQKKQSYILDPNRREQFVKSIEIPLCMDLMELMHTKAARLRDEVTRNNRFDILNNGLLRSNINEWIKVISSTHVVALILLNRPTQDDGGDLERVGLSFDNLSKAMMEEFSSIFVETILMERAKLASYLMQCAYTLSSCPDHVQTLNLSPSLNETVHVLQVFCGSCFDARSDFVRSAMQGTLVDKFKHSFFDCAVELERNVAHLVEEKFLEVALDINDMIPDIDEYGAKQFYFDTQNVSSKFFADLVEEVEPEFSRLEDTSALMSSDDEIIKSLKSALVCLVSSQDLSEAEDESKDQVIDLNVFCDDETLLNEAHNMIQAKGFRHMKTRDAINIINRRKT